VRAFADNSATTFEWLLAHGVIFVDRAPSAGGVSVGNPVPREMLRRSHGLANGANRQAGGTKKLSSGSDLIGALEAAGKKAGVQILLEHKMTAIFREAPTSGRVLGIALENKDMRHNIRAKKAVVIATGGCNVNFRRVFDPEHSTLGYNKNHH
jgi:succinate dehydrogenase/fumarate reductase flavoprotein subunit